MYFNLPSCVQSGSNKKIPESWFFTVVRNVSFSKNFQYLLNGWCLNGKDICQTSIIECFAKSSQWLLAVNYILKTLHLRCLTRFWLNLYIFDFLKYWTHHDADNISPVMEPTSLLFIVWRKKNGYVTIARIIVTANRMNTEIKLMV